MLTRRTAVRTGAAAAAAAVLAAALMAATTDHDPGRPITGDALDRATAAALAATGGGVVTETEEGDEESYYQVEVRRPDGSQVDVQLDRNFTVVATNTDGADHDRD